MIVLYGKFSPNASQGRFIAKGRAIVAPGPCLNVASVEVLHRVRAEYLEMPGLRLTPPQAQRLFGLDSETCDAVLATLLNSQFFIRTHTGLFAMAA
jgi:hypothetical protein